MSGEEVRLLVAFVGLSGVLRYAAMWLSCHEQHVHVHCPLNAHRGDVCCTYMTSLISPSVTCSVQQLVCSV